MLAVDKHSYIARVFKVMSADAIFKQMDGEYERLLRHLKHPGIGMDNDSIKKLDRAYLRRMMRYVVPGPDDVSLRVKHQARMQVRQQLLAMQALLQPFMQALDAHIFFQRPLQRCAADKAALHFCISRDHADLAAQAWAACSPRVAAKALIGPLPPFAFLPSVLADGPAR